MRATLTEHLFAHAAALAPYYDPSGASGVQYSFRGSIKAPHTVLEGGYVSFGNPVHNNWYQVIIKAGKIEVRDSGVIKATMGKSHREQIDRAVHEARKKEQYRTKSPSLAAMAAAGAASVQSGIAQSSTARAKMLRDYVTAVKIGVLERSRMQSSQWRTNGRTENKCRLKGHNVSAE